MIKLFDDSKSLRRELESASEAYYAGNPKMSDKEFDMKYDHLCELESSLPASQQFKSQVGFRSKSNGKNKVKHEFPALSLDKTKSVDQFKTNFAECLEHFPDSYLVLMYKLDGATLQVQYDNGQLQCIATRGDGYYGQDVTQLANYIIGLPTCITYPGKLVVRGECVIHYSKFNEINELTDADAKYKNPRNLAAASLTVNDPEDIKDRELHFYAFEVVHKESENSGKFDGRLADLQNMQFDIVPYICAKLDTIQSGVDQLTAKAENLDIPTDGLVGAFSEANYTGTLQGTAHHPNTIKQYAFKWADETCLTTLRGVEWSPSRTGTLTPVAIFDPVEIDGTTVCRASIHNVSILKDLMLKSDDQIEVYKANMIIPQVYRNVSAEEDHREGYILDTPQCPACSSYAVITKSDEGIETASCLNPSCPAKIIKQIKHFCSRDALDIQGLSDKTIEKLVDAEVIRFLPDLFSLQEHESLLENLEGLGGTSVNLLLHQIDKARNVTMPKFLVGLGIPGVGTKQASAIADEFNDDIGKFVQSSRFDYSNISGFGQSMNESIHSWLNNSFNMIILMQLIDEVIIQPRDTNKSDVLEGKSFVVTGKLSHFASRKDLEVCIVSNGGKVQTAVSLRTTYLINNDITSTSSKNVKAKELNIPIITESDFLNLLESESN